MPVTAPEFRAALSRFMSGVTIVSTVSTVSTQAAADAATEAGEIHGMTASAFLSVSLDPPLVLVSVSKKARFHAHVSASGRYGVSILARDQEALSNHFAGRPMAEGGPVWEREGFVTPVLAGALAQLDCALHQAVDAGDHTLFIGLVERAVVAEGEGAPLGYYRGKYVTSG